MQKIFNLLLAIFNYCFEQFSNNNIDLQKYRLLIYLAFSLMEFVINGLKRLKCVKKWIKSKLSDKKDNEN